MLVCAACAPTTYTKPGSSQSQSERDLKVCRLEGAARVTETLPRFEDYRVEVSAFAPGPYALETRMRFAAQDAAESRYRAYFDEQVRAYVALCMERKGYRSQHPQPHPQGRHHV